MWCAKQIQAYYKTKGVNKTFTPLFIILTAIIDSLSTV